MTSIRSYLIAQAKDKTNPLRFYVYAYIRSKDSDSGKAGSPYYIGKGQDNRAWAKHKYINPPKDKNLIIIVEKNLSEIGAFSLERRLIRWYGKIGETNGSLRNSSDGGEGATGRVTTLEARSNYKNANLGKNNPMFGIKQSKETIEKRVIKISGDKHWTNFKEISDETREKQSIVHKGKSLSEETKKRQSMAHTEKKNSKEHNENISKAKIGENNPMFGTKRSDDTRKKHSESTLGKKKSDSHKANMRKPKKPVICPHCGKEGGIGAMMKWHFDKCKHQNSSAI